MNTTAKILRFSRPKRITYARCKACGISFTAGNGSHGSCTQCATWSALLAGIALQTALLAQLRDGAA